MKTLATFFAAALKCMKEDIAKVTICDVKDHVATIVHESVMSTSKILDLVHSIDTTGVMQLTAISTTAKLKGKAEVIYHGVVFGRVIVPYK